VLPLCTRWDSYLIIGVYVGVATVGVFIYWFVFYTDANDGHSLVSWDQLRQWHSCDKAALANTASPFYNFSVANDGGTNIGDYACKYVPAVTEGLCLSLSPPPPPTPPLPPRC
jgi:hypothetical protein